MKIKLYICTVFDDTLYHLYQPKGDYQKHLLDFY